MAIVISIGKWGGIYAYRGFGLRICVGWIAVTILPVDGDDLLAAAAQQCRSFMIGDQDDNHSG